MKKIKPPKGKRTTENPRTSATKKTKPAEPSSVRATRSKKAPDAKILLEVADLRQRLSEAEETLTAIRKGEVDALVVSGPRGEQVYTLKGAELPYRILVESMNEGALSLTSTGSIINCNKAFANIAGTPCGMLIGTLFSDMVSNKERAKFNALWKQGVEAVAKTEIEMNFNGRTVPAYVSINAREHEGDLWVFAVVTDISERKKTEAELAEYRLHLERLVDDKTEQLQAANEELQTANEELLATNENLRESESRFHIIADNTPDHILIQDRNLRYQVVINPQLGLTEQDILGKTDFDIISREDAEKLTVLKRKVIETRTPAYIEVPLRAPDGSLAYFDGSYVPKLDAQGRVDGLIGYFRNITERKRADETLRRSEEKYRRIVETANEGIWVVDADRRTTHVNDKMAKMLGYSVQEMIGKSALEFLTEENRVLSDAKIAKRRQGMRESYELTLLRKDKSPLQALVNATPLFHTNGEFEGTLSMITDISERKQMEASLRLSSNELLSSNKELEAFSYSVSHDLRAPLRIISGFSKIVFEDYADKLDAQGRDYIARIKTGSDRMSQLIEDLLRLSHISRQKIEPLDYALSSLASDVLNSLREADPGRNIEVVIAEGLRAVVDPNLMKIALTNLLGNALKFTSKTEHARIEFGAAKQNEKTVYFVKDNGAGFDSSYAEKMFFPFQRLHSEKEFEGTGIGLAIAERIIRHHNGRIWAEGEVGKGATFFFTLG